MLRRLMIAALLGLFALAGSARADLIITVGNGTVPSGGTGMVNVSISSTTPVNLNSFSAEFLITRVSGASFVRFQSPQPNPEFTNPSYIFFGMSNDQLFAQDIFPTVTTTNYPNDTIIGGDSTTGGPGTGVPVPVAPGQALLATLVFNADQGAAPGDTFRISLVNDPRFTQFDDENGMAIPFTTTPGTVVVVAAIPEPSTLLLLGVGIAALARAGRRRSERRPEGGR